MSRTQNGTHAGGPASDSIPTAGPGALHPGVTCRAPHLAGRTWDLFRLQNAYTRVLSARALRGVEWPATPLSPAAGVWAFVMKGSGLGKRAKPFIFTGSRIAPACISVVQARCLTQTAPSVPVCPVAPHTRLSVLRCSFGQLKAAVSHLKRQASKKSEGSLAHVKGGLSTFFEAQDALSGEASAETRACMCSVFTGCHVACVYKSRDLKCAVNTCCRLGWNLFEGLAL